MPAVIAPASKLVPPTSEQTTFCSPITFATYAAPIIPPTGPDITVSKSRG